eukprot:NODE_1127_length_2091_cov_1.883534.p2 type:complete len:107 gc:universal NODE_1127_length_2091_cov_1.883534:564-884(+)
MPTVRNYRACLLCAKLKTAAQFEREGCENCEEILELKGNPSRISKLTTNSFDGMLFINDINKSWVGRYQRIIGPGLYCVSLRGVIPKEIIEEIPDFFRERNGRLRD